MWFRDSGDHRSYYIKCWGCNTCVSNHVLDIMYYIFLSHLHLYKSLWNASSTSLKVFTTCSRYLPLLCFYACYWLAIIKIIMHEVTCFIYNILFCSANYFCHCKTRSCIRYFLIRACLLLHIFILEFLCKVHKVNKRGLWALYMRATPLISLSKGLSLWHIISLPFLHYTWNLLKAL